MPDTPTAEVTPRPWRIDGYQIFGADGQFVGSTFNKNDDNLIVTAVNSYDATQKQLAALREALGEIANSAIDFDDPRISYVSMQVDRDALAEARRLLSEEES